MVLLEVLLFVLVTHDLVQVSVVDSGLLRLFWTFYNAKMTVRLEDLVAAMNLQFPILFCAYYVLQLCSSCVL